MATLSSYKGSVSIVSGLKGTSTGYPLMEAHDVLVKDGDVRLDTEITNLENRIGMADTVSGSVSKRVKTLEDAVGDNSSGTSLAGRVTSLESGLGTSSATASASGTTAWSRLKNAENEIDTLQAAVGASGNTASATGTTAWSRIKNAESDIDNLESYLGTPSDASASTGNKAWPRLKNAETDIDNLQAATGTSSTAASSSSTVAWARIKNAETDIDNLQAATGTSSTAASASSTVAWARIKNAESDIDALENAVGESDDSSTENTAFGRIAKLESDVGVGSSSSGTSLVTRVGALEDATGTSSATASPTGTTTWSRIKNAESDIDTLESAVGTSSATESATGTTAWSRIKSNQTRITTLESDVTAAKAALGTSESTASASGTSAWSRIKNAENDIDALQSSLSTLTTTNSEAHTKIINTISSTSTNLQTDDKVSNYSSLKSINTRLTEAEANIDALDANFLVASNDPTVNSTGLVTTKKYIWYDSANSVTKWYYHNGSAWTYGGVAASISIDDQLTTQGAAADAKATGDAISELSSDIQDLKSDLSINALNVANNLGTEIEAWQLRQRDNTRVSVLRIAVDPGDTIVFEVGVVFQQLLVEKYDTEGTFTGQLGWFVGNQIVQIDFTGGVTLVYRKPQNAEILVSEYDAKTYVIKANSELKQELTYVDDECVIFNVGFDDVMQGGYNRLNGVTTQVNRVRLKNFLPVSAGDRVLFYPGLYTKQILIGLVNEFLPVFETAWAGGKVDYTCEHTGNLMIMVRKNSTASEFQVNQFDAKIIIIRSTKYEIGSKKYNGYMFRSNYVPGIGFHRESDTTFTKSYSDLITEYDKIMNRITTVYNSVADTVPKPITITKNEIITTNSGYTIYSYTFRPAYPKKRIMIQAGVHGNEYEGVFALFYLLRFMYTSDYVYPKLKELVNSCEIVVIPVVNPYGFEHNTKNNGDDVNVYETYTQTTNEPKEMQAIKTVATTGTYDYEMDIHTDPYTAKKGCYGYAYVDGDMYEFLYKEILNFRDILYQEFSMFEARYYNSNDKDIIVGRIESVATGGGSVGYFYRLGIPANLIEIATGSSGSGTPFTETGSSEMMRIAVDWYGNVLLKAYECISAQ